MFLLLVISVVSFPRLDYWINPMGYEDYFIDVRDVGDNLKDVANNPNYKFVQGNICDVELVNELVKDIDIIVHFAAESHVDRSISNSKDFIRTNEINPVSTCEL